tara:strand:- start:18 stop:938 length:921 start_codon:yes stop_codon:yes gene_type:complete
MNKKLDNKIENKSSEKMKKDLDALQINNKTAKDVEVKGGEPSSTKSEAQIVETEQQKDSVVSNNKEVNLPSSEIQSNVKLGNNKDKVKALNSNNGSLGNKSKDLKNKNIKQISNKKGSNNNENPSKNLSEESEFIEKLVSINRVAKVVKGGRRFSFAALVVVGDGNGLVGHGKGKAKEVPEAIKKATDEAKSRMIRVPLRQSRTLHHDINGRFDSGKVTLRSAPSGTGVIAGGPMRSIFEALGIKDIVAKSVGSSNPHNMIRATFEALKSASSPKLISIRRGLKVNEITKRRKDSNYAKENSDAQN